MHLHGVSIKDTVQISGATSEVIVRISTHTSFTTFFIIYGPEIRATGPVANVSFRGSNALYSTLGNLSAGLMISQIVPFPIPPTSSLLHVFQFHMDNIGLTDYDFARLEGHIAAKALVEELIRSRPQHQPRESHRGLESKKYLRTALVQVTSSYRSECQAAQHITG
jgi:hypothetical protein